MAHGAGATYGFTGSGPNIAADGPPPPPLDPRSFNGFSYLLGDPPDGQRSTLGADPRKARQILEALYSLLPVGTAPLPNQNIPAGFTYLLQFIAHDLVDSTVPFWVAAESGIESRNSRAVRLQLDTLYGGGPTSCPNAFRPADGQPDFRTRLRLGRISDAKPGMTTGPCPFRDLPRLKLNPIAAHDPADAALKSEAPTPAPTNFDEISPVGTPMPSPDNRDDAASLFVADIRNDDTLVLTQLAVLFSILHNAIASKLNDMSPQVCFAFSRAAMLRMYHSVIRNDLIPRLLHKRVLPKLLARSTSGQGWIWGGKGIPLEFSHGVYRIGHAMVNSLYVFNDQNQFNITDVLHGPIIGSKVRDALPSNWILSWSNFFEFPNIKVANYSLTLSVRRPSPLDAFRLLPSVSSNTPDVLSIRDWLSAATARMWRFPALTEAIGRYYPGLKFLTPADIRTWLDGLVKDARGDNAEAIIVGQNAELLANDLPLPLYFLLEAQRDPDARGQRLGPLGSIVVGEVMFRCLEEAEASVGPILPLVHKALGDEAWARIGNVTTMPKLIQLAEDWGGLMGCQEIPFIVSPERPK